MANAVSPRLAEAIEKYTEEQYPYLLSLHYDYHAHPELSLEEHRTAARQAQAYRDAGCDAVDFFATTGVAAIIRNGDGPVLLYRNDHDALPIHEENEVPYRSTVPGVGHLCGHSMVPAISVGVARHLLRWKEHWSGTVVLVSQLGEEGANGARRMLDDGLYTRFPRPELALAWHCSPTLPGGTVGIRRGPAMALTAHLDIRVHGQGGHGGYPSTTKDPVVLAAAIIMRLQTIVSREVNPLEPAVVTVGSFVTNTQKGSVIPSEVMLKLTVRCFSYNVYQQITEAIARICRGEAIASGLPEHLFPEIMPFPYYIEPVINDEVLCRRLEGIFTHYLGREQVREEPAYTFGEDFAHYADGGNIPIAFLWLGAVDPAKFDADGHPLEYLEPLHSPRFLPHPPTTLRTGVNAMTVAILNLLQRP
jgi:hippurate hydrolase